MHTARIWMASATPGGAPGYDYDKEFGNNVTHSTARTSQRLRGYTARSPEVKGRTTLARFWQCNGVPAFRRGGICGSRYATGGPTSFVARMSEATSGASGWGIPDIAALIRATQSVLPATPSPPPVSPIQTPVADAGTR